ncbi:MBL fold metallo-hydrolase [Chroococcidiopsis sp. CCMEE 29]|uniref:MBL fold metallo-hydrolase n=1 Tax=Chroococcidiopsis sp. CCMEE 29 TaxID=155894 RepID=UPI00202253AB|nr:MBL fold metallo-hydrolase [Chroococcidiopsis sp. CCMEE 29]
MFFRQLFDLESKTYTYLIADPKIQEVVLVDPVLEQVERDRNLLQELGFKLRYCLETHIHADHITGTAGEEKRWNPRFSGRDRASFIKLMTNLELPEPQKMMEAIPANEHCGNVASSQMLTSPTQH